MKKNCLLKKYFYSSTKDGKTGDDGKISDRCISVKDCLICEKTWGKFDMKNMGDYHDHYFQKKMYRYQQMFSKSLLTYV